MPTAEWQTPPRPLISPKTAALRRLAELRNQHASFLSQVPAAEAEVVRVRAIAPSGARTSKLAVRMATVEDDLHRLTTAARNAGRIVEECERGYQSLFGEPAPAEICDCGRCHELKSRADFRTIATDNGPRRFTYCRACEREIRRATYHRYKPERLAANAAYRRANREKVNARNRARYRENHAAIRAYQNAYARDHPRHERTATRGD